MDDSIVFLGTGGARHVMVTQDRSTAGFIVRADGVQIHVDPGPGTVIMAKKYEVNLKDTSIIFVSHSHPDHANDANLMIDIITNMGERKAGTLICNKTVDKEILTDYHVKHLNEKIILKPGEKTDVNNLQFLATKTKNQDQGIGFRLRTQKFCLGYTSDTFYFAELGNAFKGCDIMIVNNMTPFGGERFKKHLSSEDTVKLLKKVKPKLAIIQHFGGRMLEKNPMYEAREIQKQSGVQVIAATDGLVIDPESYSAESNQKLLQSFE